jgi:hypothetical protein
VLVDQGPNTINRETFNDESSFTRTWLTLILAESSLMYDRRSQRKLHCRKATLSSTAGGSKRRRRLHAKACWSPFLQRSLVYR